MNHKGTTMIETERLVLRRFETTDTDVMFRNWASDPEVTKYLTWQPHETIELTKKLNLLDIAKYESPTHYQWAIELKKIQEVIGGVNVVKLDETCDSVELAYRVGKAWWHQGIVPEAVKAVIEFLFEEVGVNRIAATYDTRNKASGVVMKKCGMQYEGTLRQAAVNNQGVYDVRYYSILKEEYEKERFR